MRGTWTRELVELAVLFGVIAAADLSADSFTRISLSAIVLTGLAVVLLVGAVLQSRAR
jgi:hypothetical protein